MALHVIAWHRMRENGARARSTLDRLETVEGAEDAIVDAVSTIRRRRFFFPWMWLRRGVEERSSSSSVQLRGGAAARRGDAFSFSPHRGRGDSVVEGTEGEKARPISVCPIDGRRGVKARSFAVGV